MSVKLPSIPRRGFLSAGLVLVTSCSPAVVRPVPNTPITPDARGGLLVVVNAGRAHYGPVYIGSDRILGACVPMTHVVTLVAPGRQLIVVYDDESYDAAEVDLAPGGIYTIEIEHSEGELEIHPLIPGRDPIRRLLDDVELARAPNQESISTFERKVRLGRLRYAEYPASKRAARAVGPASMWR